MIITDGIITDEKTDKTDYQKFHGRNIDKTSNGRYRIRKVFSGKTVYFGTYDTFMEAVTIRDKLIDNDWDKSILVSEEDKIMDYYSLVHSNGDYCFEVRRPKNNKNGLPRYMGTCNSIEEALYYRDIAKTNNYIIGKPIEYDLITDNPYIINGLKYPLPDRLKKHKTRNQSHYAKGYIKKKSHNSYQVWYNKKYYGSYTTPEYAEYIRLKLYENNWNTNKIEEIKKAYPEYYTYILHFWRYIKHNEKHNTWSLFKPLDYKKGDVLQFTFKNPEDVLYERDLYEKYDWDMDTVVELAEDTYNKYYDMNLPPYPTRRKNINYGIQEKYEKILEDIIFFINEFNITSYHDMCETLDITSMRPILKKYNTTWTELKNIITGGENPLELLTFNGTVQPDLKPVKSKNNYIYYDKSSKYTPWLIRKDNIYYGRYPSKKIARKIVNRLKKCNWDKKQLTRIREEIGYVSPSHKGETSKLIYLDKRNPKNIRYYIKYLSTYYGSYDTMNIAQRVVKELKKVDWDKKQLPQIKEKIGV